MRHRCRRGAALLAAVLSASPALAGADDPPVALRVAVHDGYTRLVFDFTRPAAMQFHRNGSSVQLQFSAPGMIVAPPGFDAATLHNLRSAELGDGVATLTLAAGVTVHSVNLGKRRVVDLIDPGRPVPKAGKPPAVTEPVAAAPAKSAGNAPAVKTGGGNAGGHAAVVAIPRAAVAAPVAVAPRPPIPAPAVSAMASPAAANAPAVAPPATGAASATAAATVPPGVAGVAAAPPQPPAVTEALSAPPGQEPSLPVSRADGPAPERVLRAPLTIDPAGPLVLPFAASTGAAAFRRGTSAVVVFDEPRAIDEASLRAHPGLETATVQLLPQAVVLRFALPRDKALALTHDGSDWTIATVDAALPRPTDPMAVAAMAGSLHLAAVGNGHVVVVPDPRTGDTLLVGTQPIQGAYMAEQRRYAEFMLLPSFLGAALDPLSDRVALRMVADGFVVGSATPTQALALSAAATDPALALAAARLTRSFEFPAETAPALLRRLHGQILDAAATPLLGRLPYRRAAAQTMVALGLGPEAQAVLLTAAADDPRALTDPPTQALAAAAALLAGRLGETGGLAIAAPAPGAAVSPETDERRLWRGLLAAARLADGERPSTETTQAIAAGVPLLLSYPPTLQRCLLPLAADALLRGQDLAAAHRLLSGAPGDPDLDLARAAALQADGQTVAALVAYDRLAMGRDRSMRARAAVAALDLRTATSRMTPAQAADAGERLIYSWRGDGRERDLRLRIAAWRGQAAQFRQQLETLRDTLDVYPDPADGIRAQLGTAFDQMVRSDKVDKLAPIDLVALVQANADLLPDGPNGEAVVGKLADRLGALDLPQQAADVLRRLLRDTKSPSARAVFGARLAALELGDGQAQPALDALSQSDAPTLSAALTEQRALLAAHAHAVLGDKPAALATLAPLASGPEALLARAQLHEDAHEWPDAEAALASFVQTLPTAGRLDPAQSGVVLRLASATAQAGDEAGLAKLRANFAGRLPDGNDAALLAVLTESPVKGVADLPRAAKENAAARALPAELQQMAHAQ